MEELNDDRKKEEEEYGGFEPEDSEEDSFILDEDSDYPSKLPSNFSDEDDSEPVSENESNVSEEEEEKDQDGEEEESEEKQGDEETKYEREEEEIEDKPSEEEAEEISDEEVSEAAEPAGEETVVMDDDFKKELQKDLDESKKARQEDETQELHDVEKGESAKSIGDDADTVVTFDKIEADKPSNFGLPPLVDREYENVDTEDVSQVNTEEIQQESDSKKKLPVWMLMLYTAAATFILTSALAIIIWQAYLNEEEEINEQTTEAMEEDMMIPADTLDEEGFEEDISDRELLEKFEDDTNEIESEPLVKPEILEELDKAKEKQITKDSKDLAAKSTKVPETEKNIEPPKKQAKQPNTDTKKRSFSMPQPEGPAPEKGVYTVQIYSSPSLEDAERWLERLENKDIKSGFISKHVIKDKMWYRVRYGEFETKQEARASALEMGFSQSWIDRVK